MRKIRNPTAVPTSQGIFITTSDFHSNAREYAGLHQKVILVDGRRLAELMIEHNIGVAEEQVFRLKRVDSDYFAEFTPSRSALRFAGHFQMPWAKS